MESVFTHQQDLSPKLINLIWWNFLLKIYSKICYMYCILVSTCSEYSSLCKKSNSNMVNFTNMMTLWSRPAKCSRSGIKILVGGQIFCTCTDQSWWPSSLLYNGYHICFSPHLVKERVKLCLYSPSGPPRPVRGWTLHLPFTRLARSVCYMNYRFLLWYIVFKLALGLTQPLTETSTRNISWGVKVAGA